MIFYLSTYRYEGHLSNFRSNKKQSINCLYFCKYVETLHGNDCCTLHQLLDNYTFLLYIDLHKYILKSLDLFRYFLLWQLLLAIH